MSTDTKHSDDFVIHGLARNGLNYVADAPPGNPYGARPGHLRFGEELLVTAELVAANTDRNGDCWLLLSEEEQLERYNGAPRFGLGPTPANVVAQVAAARREELLEQRRNLLATSPAGAGRYQAERTFLDQLDAELAAIDGEGVGS